MGRRKKIIEVELEKDQYLPEKSSIPQLSGKFFTSFSGDTYNHAIQGAWEWVESVSKNKNALENVVLQDYYHQKAFGGRSIIVSYNRIPK